MKQFLKIDEEGYYIEPVILDPIDNNEGLEIYFIEDYIELVLKIDMPEDLDEFLEDYNLPNLNRDTPKERMIGEPFTEGMYKPRWNGTEWVDEITEEELQAIKDEALEQAKLQPPTVDEMSMKIRAMENVMNDLVKKFIIADNLTEDQKDEIISQYRAITLGDMVYPDEVVNINGKLFKMIQPIALTIYDENWLQEGSVFAPFLQTEIDDTPVVQEFKQPLGTHDAYQIGDKVLFNGDVYESTIDNNTWSPADYPQAWKLIE